MQIEDWAFGSQREPANQRIVEVVRRQYQIAPHFPLSKAPRFLLLWPPSWFAHVVELPRITREAQLPGLRSNSVDDGSTDRTRKSPNSFQLFATLDRKIRDYPQPGMQASARPQAKSWHSLTTMPR
jgi:hypothetical protein